MNRTFGWASLLTSLTIVAIAPPAVATCSAEIETVTPQLLADLPSYANRVRQRSRDLESGRSQTYTVIAGQTDFEPLPVRANDSTTEQVFFTTLEQVFSDSGVHTEQQFHWLFLTPTPQGWYMATLYSRFGVADPQREPTPPRETSNGIVGQAVKLWLRDCRAGTVR